MKIINKILRYFNLILMPRSMFEQLDDKLSFLGRERNLLVNNRIQLERKISGLNQALKDKQRIINELKGVK